MSYGEKISELRKKNGMTQATLGEKLNVTYQAVSKWERDESDPDFATMSKIAKLFDVPLSYFEEEEPAPTAEQQEEAAVTVAPAVAIAPVAEAPQKTAEELKAEIKEEMKAEAENAKREEERRARIQKEEAWAREQAYEKAKVLKIRNRGLIGGALIALALCIIVIVCGVISKKNAGIIAAVAGTFLVLGFVFTSQLFWDGFIVDVVSCGLKIIGTPGIIFSFDLDGFIFLIAMKILFAIIKIIVLMLSFLFFVLIGIILSPFTFVPCCIKLTRGDELG